MNFKVLISAALASVLAVAGCSDDTTSGTGGTAGGGGGGGVGGEGGGTPVTIDCDTDLPDASAYVVGEVFDSVPATSSADCTGDTFMPGPDAANRLNARLENADPGDVICLAEGNYDMESTISISLVPGLTIKGIGDSPDDTELLFGGPGTGRGIFVQTDDVVIENLRVRNSGANGIEQEGTNGSVFRKVHVSWDDFCDTAEAPDNCGNVCAEDADCDDPLLACEDDSCVGDQGKNGAYGIYPTNCENTTVEYTQATGASDAGIYIGKCGWLDDETTGGVVRYNIAANNVAGLEVENCLDVVAHDNLVFGNTGGLMPLQQPISADRPANTGILMEDNKVYCNNGKNFAETGVVQIIPVGSGVVSLGGQGVEMRNNDIQGNDTLGIALVSSAFTCDAAGADCPPYAYPYNPYAQMIFAHDNFFLNNGENAQTTGDFGIIFDLLDYGTPENPTPDVMWGGSEDPDVADPEICLGTDYDGSYLDLTSGQCSGLGSVPEYAGCILANNTTDTDGRLCDLDLGFN